MSHRADFHHDYSGFFVRFLSSGNSTRVSEKPNRTTEKDRLEAPDPFQRILRYVRAAAGHWAPIPWLLLPSVESRWTTSKT